ncbi:MAG: response regulator [Actinomycetia bacterium]|nr:response regulator [Actinomycetes bacterium]
MTSPAPIRTLVIEDDPALAQNETAILSQVPGFAPVGEAHSVAEAIAAIDRLRPNLVLLDVTLPDGSGLDVLRAIRGRAEPCDAIMVTAATDMATGIAARRMGAVSYLAKPFRAAALRAKLEEYRDRRTRLASPDAKPTQADFDTLFGVRAGADAGAPAPAACVEPSSTASRVLDAVRLSGGGLSTDEAAKAANISRATAQRCLAELERAGQVRAEPQYGALGRPPLRYTATIAD